MSSLFGGTKARASTPSVPAPDLTLTVQTSIQGKPRPIGWGTAMLAGNILDMADHNANLQATYSQAPKSSGKGGFFGGGGGSSGLTINYYYTYSVALILSLCEGPIQGVNRFTEDGISFGDGVPGDSTTVFTGTQTQTPWSYMTVLHPDRALAYRGDAYVAYGPMDLGTNTNIPSIRYEVAFGISSSGPQFPQDANPADVVYDFMTNSQYGIPGWPASLMGDLSWYRAYCQATGMVVSPILTDQTEASSFLATLMQGTNSEIVWSGGKMQIVPYGDAPLSANGAVFAPNTTPVYAIQPSDLMAVQGGSGSITSTTPIEITRTSAQNLNNSVQIEYLDRSNVYASAIIEQQDEASIAASRERPTDVREMHMFCLASAASMSCALQLTREQIANQYLITLPRSFILLDPMDLITLPLDQYGLADAPRTVRIKEITENSDYSLTMSCEDWLGTASAPLYARQGISHNAPNYNVDPGNVNPPVLFEPPDEVAGGLFVYAAISGANIGAWGGCNVWASFDDTNYVRIQTVKGATRHGVLTADLPSIAAAISGQTLDRTNTLKIDLSVSGTSVGSGSETDMLSLATDCWVEGEILSYENAVLTAASQYSLSPMVRGAYGTSIADHPAGSRFVRLDGLVSEVPYDQSKIGQTLYLKFTSFNIWGGAEQTLDEVAAYSYLLTGAALTSPLPDVANLVTNFSDGFMALYWDEIDDFRTGIRYKIYKGDTFASALEVNDVAHPPYRLDGDGTYWVTGYCTPLTGLRVFSEYPQSLTVSGTILVANPLISRDQQAENWPGIMTGCSAVGSAGSQVLQLADGVAEGDYEIPNTDWIDAGYATSCSVSVTYKPTGAQKGQNVLAIPDVLSVADWLGSSSSMFVDCVIEIATAPDLPADAYAAADVYAAPDAYAAAVVWGAWQTFNPGIYYGRYFKIRARLMNSNPSQVTAYLLAMKFTVSVPTRIDHYQSQNIPAAGLQITFTPDKAAKAAPFRGGPNNSALPFIQITSAGGTAGAGLQPGDHADYTNLTLAGCTIVVTDSNGNPVARSGINISAEGY